MTIKDNDLGNITYRKHSLPLIADLSSHYSIPSIENVIHVFNAGFHSE